MTREIELVIAWIIIIIIVFEGLALMLGPKLSDVLGVF